MNPDPERLWRLHVLVCTNEREPSHPRPSCGPRGGTELLAWFQEAIRRHKLNVEIRANRSGCLDACEAGPSVVVYPDAVWYTLRTQAEVERVVTEHLRDGRPVAELRMDFTPVPAWQARQKKQRS